MTRGARIVLIFRHALLHIGNMLPRYHSADLVRTSLYRFSGLRIGRDSRIAGPLVLDISLRIDTFKFLEIGSRTYINFNCRISSNQSLVTIGDDCLIGPNVSFETAGHSIELPRTAYTRPIRVGDHVWIGANAVILPGVTIGDNAVVAAGAVVDRDVNEGALVGGVPARPLRSASGGHSASMSDR
jgi:maltose O-acetyltransferase